VTADRTVRQARPGDHDAVEAFTEDTWPDREIGDYVPEVFPEWVETDGPDQYTVVTEIEGEAVGLAQATMLTDDEAWLQGLRVHPDHRGRGHSMAMTDALLAWCRDCGATVARNMVFDWNPAGMAQSRAAGLHPVTACRWARPEPQADGESTRPDLSVREDADAAWRYWTHSDTREALDGLVLAEEETWALSELARERFERLAADGRALAVVGEGVRGATVRLGTREREGETVVDYAVAAWADADAARKLFDAIRADTASLGGDNTRVLIPETPRHVSGAALARTPLSDHSVYVFAADPTSLTP
jgi:GNAT superfamily N-acetyltransferase